MFTPTIVKVVARTAQTESAAAQAEFAPPGSDADFSGSIMVMSDSAAAPASLGVVAEALQSYEVQGFRVEMAPRDFTVSPSPEHDSLLAYRLPVPDLQLSLADTGSSWSFDPPSWSFEDEGRPAAAEIKLLVEAPLEDLPLEGLRWASGWPDLLGNLYLEMPADLLLT